MQPARHRCVLARCCLLFWHPRRNRSPYLSYLVKVLTALRKLLSEHNGRRLLSAASILSIRTAALNKLLCWNDSGSSRGHNASITSLLASPVQIILLNTGGGPCPARMDPYIWGCDGSAVVSQLAAAVCSGRNNGHHEASAARRRPPGPVRRTRGKYQRYQPE